jgi:glucose-1-phosphatase
MLKNILFDFGNVLFDIDIPRIEREFRIFFGEKYDAVNAQLLKEKIFTTWEVGGLTEEEFLDSICLKANPPLAHEAVRTAWNSIFMDMPLARFDFLKKLRAKYSVFMLSNINPTHADFIDDYFLKKYGFTNWQAEYFDAVYYSHLIRLRKPTRESFEYVLADAEIKAEETLFIDDLPENIETARLLGFQTLLFPVRSEITNFEF